MKLIDLITTPSRLGRQLMLRLLVVTSLLIVLFASAQIYLEYRRDIRNIQDEFTLIGDSFQSSISDNVFSLDRDQLASILNGMVRLHDLRYAEVRVNGELLVSAGELPTGKEELTKVLPLTRLQGGKQQELGELRVITDFSKARQHLLRSTWQALLVTAIETLIVVLFLYFFVHLMLTRHLVNIARYVNDASLAPLDLPLHLQRKPSPLGKEDEFDQLVAAFNKMRQNLLLSYESLRASNADLERRVADRTIALRRQVEDSMRSQRELKSSQDQLQTIFDSALEGIVVTDVQGFITVFNPAAERLFGFNREEILGSSLNRLMPESVVRLHDGYIRRYIASNQASTIGTSREELAQRADGTLFPIQISVSEARQGDERLFIGVLHDLSERKRFEEALMQAKLLAEEANRAKSEFLSHMSHELRTPLNAIIGFSKLLATDPLEPPTAGQKESIDQILLAGRHLLELINGILDLARIESGRTEISIEPVDVLGMCKELQLLIQPLADQAEVSLRTFDPTSTRVRVLANRLRLKQCLLNLLSNAIKYNRRHGYVYLRIAESEGWVAIAVEDSGIGFSEAQKSRLFIPFDRLGREQAEAEGFGIGLTITRRLVEEMGGRIEAEGLAGVGSTFTLHFPAVSSAK